MKTQQAILVGLCIYPLILAATTYFTRATRRRFLGAVAGGLSVAVVGVGVEVLAHALGLWRYPSIEQPYGPPLLYPLAVVVFAILALLGWRVMRWFGWRGEIVFLTALAVVGMLRDYFIAQPMGIIVFAPGPLTVVVDAACWIGTTALAQATMRVVAGPAAADGLARRPAR